MNIIDLHTSAAAHLAAKAELRGVTVLSVDRLDILNEVDRAIAELGVAAIVGTAQGSNEAPNHRAPNFKVSLGVRVIENVVINRNRPLFATVPNEAARLALSGVAIGQRVHQSDNNTDYWLFTGNGSSGSHWGKIYTATEILELVIRSLHFWHPEANTTLVAEGFEFGEEESFVDVTARFNTRVYLNPEPPA